MKKVLQEVREQKETIKQYQNQHREAEAEISALRSQMQLFKRRKSPSPPPPVRSTTARIRTSPPKTRASSSTTTRICTSPPKTRAYMTSSRGASRRTQHKRPSNPPMEKSDNKRKRVRSVVEKSNKGNYATSSSPSKVFSKMAAKRCADPLDLSPRKKLKMAAGYCLPPIKKDLLKKIKKREFCCFDLLKPKKLYLKSQEEQQGGEKVDLRFDEKKQKLQVSKRKLDCVQNFAEWMEVWNLFTQAHLHFFPEDTESLFAYQKSITRFSSRYTFEAVYSYDIDFRNLIAVEKHLPREHRQVRWSKVSDELVHIHLRDNRRPEPMCYKCKEKGHYANKCPFEISGTHRSAPGPPPVPPMAQPLMGRSVFPPMSSMSGGQRAPQMQQRQRMLPSTNGQNNNNNRNGTRNGGYNPNNGFCRHYAVNMTCPYGRGCIFKHGCEGCGREGHNLQTCFSHTSTTFRPQW